LKINGFAEVLLLPAFQGRWFVIPGTVEIRGAWLIPAPEDPQIRGLGNAVLLEVNLPMWKVIGKK